MEMLELPGYEVIGRIGQGGMATVYKARQISLDRIVAVKVLTRSMLPDAQALERFQQEAQAAARINHPGIVQVHDYGERAGVAYLVMEFIEGHSVGELLETRGRMPVVEALAIAENMAEALAHAWNRARLIHCDIKPDNVMITTHGVVKVMDLGLSRIIGRHVPGEDDTIIGTPNYASPEQALGDPDLDCRTDLYSLGATLYHMLTGIMPFGGSPGSSAMDKHVSEFLPDPIDVNADISAPAAWLLEKLMVKDKAKRVATWEDVVADLEQVKGSRYPLPPMPEAGSSTVRRSAKRPQPVRGPAGPAAGTEAMRLVPAVRPPLVVRKPQAQPVAIVVGKETSDLERAVITFVALVCAVVVVYSLAVWKAGRQRMSSALKKNPPAAVERPAQRAPAPTPRPVAANPVQVPAPAPAAAPVRSPDTPASTPPPPSTPVPPRPTPAQRQDVREPAATPAVAAVAWDRETFNKGAVLFNGALESYQAYQATRRNPGVLGEVEADCRQAIALFESVKDQAPKEMHLDQHIRNCYRLIEDSRQSRTVVR
jgi:tRNA A-37 threonylcarbamoyl transferase component Bud32